MASQNIQQMDNSSFNSGTDKNQFMSPLMIKFQEKCGGVLLSGLNMQKNQSMEPGGFHFWKRLQASSLEILKIWTADGCLRLFKH